MLAAQPFSVCSTIENQVIGDVDGAPLVIADCQSFPLRGVDGEANAMFIANALNAHRDLVSLAQRRLSDLLRQQSEGRYLASTEMEIQQALMALTKAGIMTPIQTSTQVHEGFAADHPRRCIVKGGVQRACKNSDGSTCHCQSAANDAPNPSIPALHAISAYSSNAQEGFMANQEQNDRINFIRETVAVGTQVLSIEGEMATGEDDQEHETGPEARGVVLEIFPEQENCYLVAFPDHFNLTVYLSAAELADESKYLLADPGERT